MKKLNSIIKTFLIVLFATLFVSCNSSDKKNDQQNKIVVKQDSVVVNSPVVEEKNIIPICKEKESKAEEGLVDPILTKTCVYGNFKFVSIGSSDYKGRYSYEYKVYETINNKEVVIKNENFFNDKNKELSELINKKIKTEYNELMKDEEVVDCFEEFKLPKYTINDFGIDFSDDNVNFSITYGLSGACMSVDGTIITLPLSEVKKYIKK